MLECRTKVPAKKQKEKLVKATYHENCNNLLPVSVSEQGKKLHLNQSFSSAWLNSVLKSITLQKQ